MNLMQTAILGCSIALAMVALALLWRGNRGRRIDDHPVCRRCGYDLTGRPADSNRCSECGTDLNMPRAIQTGHRRRRWALLMAGLILFCGSSTPYWPPVRQRLDAQPWMHWMPFRVLMYETYSQHYVTARDALAEMEHRYFSHRLDHAQRKRLADRLLDRQLTFGSSEADIIETTFSEGDVPPARWETYWRSLSGCELLARAQVRRGEPIPVRLRVMEGNVEIWPKNHFGWTATTVDVDGLRCDPAGLAGSFDIDFDDAGQTGEHGDIVQIVLTKDALERLKDGPHTVHAQLRLDCLHRVTTMVSAPFSLVPADASTARLDNSP